MLCYYAVSMRNCDLIHPTQEHVYAVLQPTTHAGCMSVFCHQEICTLIVSVVQRKLLLVTYTNNDSRSLPHWSGTVASNL